MHDALTPVNPKHFTPILYIGFITHISVCAVPVPVIIRYLEKGVRLSALT